MVKLVNMKNPENNPQPEKIEEEIKQATLEARKQPTVELLESFKTFRRELENIPDSKRTDEEEEKLSSVEKIDEALDLLKKHDDKDNDIEPGLKMANQIIGGRTKELREDKRLHNTSEGDDAIIKMIAKTIECAKQKNDENVSVVELRELSIYKSYLREAEAKAKGDKKTEIEDLGKQLSDLKEKMFPPEPAKPAEKEKPAKPEKTKKDVLPIKPEASVEEPEGVGEILEKVEPFKEYENKAREKLVEKYIPGIEIGEETKTFLEKYFAQDTEEWQKTFAKLWCESHKDKVQDLLNRKVILKEPSDDEKLGFLETNMGINVLEEIRKKPKKGEEDYRWIGKKMDRIGVLRDSIAPGKKILPETSFLLLNYLETNSKDENVALFQIQKELVEKTLGVDLNEQAESKLAKEGFPSKGQYVESEKNIRVKGIEINNNELFKKECLQNSFEKEKRKYGNDPAKLMAEIISEGRDLGLSDQESLALESAGFKIHGTPGSSWREAGRIIKGVFTHPFKTVLGATSEGGFIDLGLGNGVKSVKEIKLLAQSVLAEQNRKIDAQAKEFLEDEWEKEHDKKIKEEIQRRVEELAKSPDVAGEEIERKYTAAKERITAEYIRSRMEEKPETAEQIKTFDNELSESKKEIDVNNAIAGMLEKRGILAELESGMERGGRDGWRAIIHDYLNKELGVKLHADAYNIPQEDYDDLIEKPTGVFYLIMRMMRNHAGILKREKKVKTKTKRKTK
ncbi:MAG: hypothetical protein NTV36_02850 [Candidatus Staskawiczbacteria bacterium]|nr:hypothetical protein [Candidatus Staskawiczbacteria bacterium]